MRILFAASPAIAVPALEAAFETACDSANGGSFEIAGLLTNPDSPKGRSGKPQPTETAAALERLSSLYGAAVPALKPEKLDAAARNAVAALRPDILVSFAYGKIFGPKFLALFPLGGINIHPSLLPAYRGPAPIQAAILNRDRETGLTIQRLAQDMDSGDIVAQERFPLRGRETAAELSAIMAQKAAEMLPAVLRAFAGGTARGTPQNHSQATYCSMLSADAGRIDWGKSALEIDAQIRAFDPWPLSWTMRGEERLFILKAAPLDIEGHGAGENPEQTAKAPGQVLGMDKRCGILIQTGQGILAVTELQYRAKKALEWRAFLNGARNFLGAYLGQDK